MHPTIKKNKSDCANICVVLMRQKNQFVSKLFCEKKQNESKKKKTFHQSQPLNIYKKKILIIFVSLFCVSCVFVSFFEFADHNVTKIVWG